MSELLRLSEVRTKLGVCKDTILKWIRQGTLPSAVKLNGRHYFVAADIELWLKDNGKTIKKWKKKEQVAVEQVAVEQAAVEQVAVEQVAVTEDFFCPNNSQGGSND